MDSASRHVTGELVWVCEMAPTGLIERADKDWVMESTFDGAKTLGGCIMKAGFGCDSVRVRVRMCTCYQMSSKDNARKSCQSAKLCNSVDTGLEANIELHPDGSANLEKHHLDTIDSDVSNKKDGSISTFICKEPCSSTLRLCLLNTLLNEDMPC